MITTTDNHYDLQDLDRVWFVLLSFHDEGSGRETHGKYNETNVLCMVKIYIASALILPKQAILGHQI